MHVYFTRLTQLKVMLLVCEDDAEPAGHGAGEGLTAAQHHLVSEETPPQRQLLLERRLCEALPKRRDRSDASSLHGKARAQCFQERAMLCVMSYVHLTSENLKYQPPNTLS